MPNKNYVNGRAFEYETMDSRRKMGMKVLRTSGSHGEFDVIAYRDGVKPVFIQCKVVTTEAAAKRLTRTFVENTVPHIHFHQCLSVKVKGKWVTEVTI